MLINISINSSSDCPSERMPSFGKDWQTTPENTECQCVPGPWKHFLWISSFNSKKKPWCPYSYHSSLYRWRQWGSKKKKATCPHYAVGSNTAEILIQAPWNPEKILLTTTDFAMGSWFHVKPHPAALPVLCLWRGMILKG